MQIVPGLYSLGDKSGGYVRAELKAATGARVYCHDWEAPVIEGTRKVQVPMTTTLIPQKPLQIYPLQVAFVPGLRMPPPA